MSRSLGHNQTSCRRISFEKLIVAQNLSKIFSHVRSEIFMAADIIKTSFGSHPCKFVTNYRRFRNHLRSHKQILTSDYETSLTFNQVTRLTSREDFIHFSPAIEPISSLPCSRNPASEPYPIPVESSPHSRKYFFKARLTIITPSTSSSTKICGLVSNI
jgi:hypothetical protein